jgi:hypothetical protein
MRERLDVLSPHQLRRPFKKIFAYLQRGKALESYRYLGGHYIISLFERVRVLAGMIVFNSWEHLYTFIGVPESRPPPEQMLGGAG